MPPPLPVCCTASRNLLVLGFFFWVSILREGEGLVRLHYLAVDCLPLPPNTFPFWRHHLMVLFYQLWKRFCSLSHPICSMVWNLSLRSSNLLKFTKIYHWACSKSDPPSKRRTIIKNPTWNLSIQRMRRLTLRHGVDIMMMVMNGKEVSCCMLALNMQNIYILL